MESIFGNGSASYTATWRPEPIQRGTYGILSTCVVTLALCVWTAIHLNVPAHEGWLKPALRKFGWSILGFLAPEMVAFTAYQQYTTAKHLTRDLVGLLPVDDDKLHQQQRRECASKPNSEEHGLPAPRRGCDARRREKWTLIHSYFAVMGGFEVTIDERHNFFPRKNSDGERRNKLTITPDGLRLLAEYRPCMVPDLSWQKIQDKSKGSALAKTVVVTQASWFCVQCITRIAQHLPITLLELNTLGHAICALLVYYLWWHKPLDIEVPEQIVTTDHVAPLVAATRRGAGWSAASVIGKRVAWASSLDTIVRSRKVIIGTLQLLVFLMKYSSSGPALEKLTLRVFRDDDSPINSPIKRRVKVTANTTDGLRLIGASRFNAEASIRISGREVRRWKLALLDVFPIDFYGPRKELLKDRMRNFPRHESVSQSWPLYIGFSITGLIYGGLHCLAWNALFLTGFERLLWRLSSVVVSSTGVLVALVYSWEVVPPVWERVHETGDIGKDLRQFQQVYFLKNVTQQLARRAEVVYSNLPRRMGKAFVWMVVILFFLVGALLLLIKVLYDVTIVICLMLYCLARFYLVVECFINLLYLPDAAYLVPQWSQYIPHIS